jgi:hypothetical protein
MYAMSVIALTAPTGRPQEDLYDLAMPKTELMGVEALRKVLGPKVKDLRNPETPELHTVVTMHGGATAVLVSIGWYRKAREALGEPTDL